MHELSIVQKIVAAANTAAEKNHISQVKTLKLRLGQMAAASPDQLNFGFETYDKGTRLAKAKLHVEEVKVLLECQNCRCQFGDPRFEDQDFAHTIAHAPMAYTPPPCPKCKNEDSRIVRGQEMELIGLEGE